MKKIRTLEGVRENPPLTKWIRIMKLTCLILTFALVQVSAETYSQTKKLTLNLKDAPLAVLFEEIEKTSEFNFFYDSSGLDLSEKVTVTVEDSNIEAVLDMLFTNSDISYEISDRYIILKSKEGENIRERLFTQQQRSVSGNVTDFGGQPLPGVTVVIKGTTQGTVTNADGDYTLTNIPEDATLVFSFVGMRTQEVVVGTQTRIDVRLEEETIGLEEVVAIGYGTQKKENVIGSLTTVDNQEIMRSPVGQLSNAITGKMPGIITRQGDGLPGVNSATIYIRGRSTLGNASPLVVIDGVADRDMNSINPSDIENITILKDASAGIYGARAANGVILITTKSGSVDAKPTFEYRFTQGFQTPSKMAEMANAFEYATMIREMQTYKNVSESNMIYSLDDIEKFKSGEFPWTHPNTDYYKETNKKYADMNTHTFSVSGGSKHSSYYGSFGYLFEDALYKNSVSNYERYNIKLYLNTEINQYLSLGLDILGSMENKTYPTRARTEVWGSIRRGRPTEPAYYPNGLPGPDIEFGDNPVVITTDKAGYNAWKDYRLYTKFMATLRIPEIDGLTLNGIFGFDQSFEHDKLWQKPFSLYSLDVQSYLNAGNTGKEDGSEFIVENFPKGLVPEPQLSENFGEYTRKYFNLKLDYNRTFNEVHSLDAFIAMESQDNYNQWMSAFRRYYLTDLLPYLFAGGSEDWRNDGSASVDGRLNYFGRVSYNYDEKYLLQFSLRRDGSLRFSEDAGRWGNFPSVLAGWRISSEDFWAEGNINNYIDYLKFKISYGQLGNDAVNAFQYLGSYGFTTGVAFDGKYATSLNLANTPNPNITWEVANLYNFGFESKLLNRITLNTDIFYQRRSNILVKRNASIPSYTGLSLPDENFGIVDNKGIEFELAYSEQAGDFTYGISGNFAYMRNEIVEYDEPERTVPWQELTGHPYGAILLYNAIGIFRDEEHVNSLAHLPGARPGDIIIEDIDGDEKITADDRIIFDKAAIPQTNFGITFDIGYKNWNFSALIQGTGSTLINMSSDDRVGTGGNYFKYEFEDRWTPDNIDATKPRAYEREEPYWRSTHKTNYFYQENGYARLKNINLSYTIPNRFANKILLKNAELFFTGNNLLILWSQNKIQDPENNHMQTYPIMRNYSIGARISF